MKKLEMILFQIIFIHFHFIWSSDVPSPRPKYGRKNSDKNVSGSTNPRSLVANRKPYSREMSLDYMLADRETEKDKNASSSRNPLRPVETDRNAVVREMSLDYMLVDSETEKDKNVTSSRNPLRPVETDRNAVVREMSFDYMLVDSEREKDKNVTSSRNPLRPVETDRNAVVREMSLDYMLVDRETGKDKNASSSQNPVPEEFDVTFQGNEKLFEDSLFMKHEKEKKLHWPDFYDIDQIKSPKWDKICKSRCPATRIEGKELNCTHVKYTKKNRPAINLKYHSLEESTALMFDVLACICYFRDKSSSKSDSDHLNPRSNFYLVRSEGYGYFRFKQNRFNLELTLDEFVPGDTLDS